MGLDMYLNRMPRYQNTTAEQVSNIESYFDWLDAKKSGSKDANCTLKQWCGVSENELPSQDVLAYYEQFYVTRYSDWDEEHKYPHKRIIESVGYWRKANAIHHWFVENIQDGEDDCAYHHEVTKDKLEELLDTCNKVLASCIMILGQVKNGERFTEKGWEPIYEPGKVVIDSSVAEELLPATSGFFFGGTNYDEYYVDDIADTIQILTRVLSTTDFNTQQVYYVSSW